MHLEHSFRLDCVHPHTDIYQPAHLGPVKIWSCLKVAVSAMMAVQYHGGHWH